MLLSQYLLPTAKEAPKDTVIASHKLMIRAGMIKQLASGFYSYLPTGVRVLHKIANIIREELNKVGAQEVLLPILQPASIWQKSGRLDEKSDLSEQMFKVMNNSNSDFVLAPTAEEAVTELFSECIQSYKDIGKTLYQVSPKFRSEIRPRFGVMRAREFLMKDGIFV